jgi:hypothetical protein
MNVIAKAILVVGLAAVSIYGYVKTNGEAGGGWGLLAILVLLFF